MHEILPYGIYFKPHRPISQEKLDAINSELQRMIEDIENAKTRV